MSCHGCKKSLIGLSKFHQCSACKLSRFCSRECWEKVKEGHKAVCTPFVDTIREEYLRAKRAALPPIGDTLTANYTEEELADRAEKQIPDFQPRRQMRSEEELKAANEALLSYATIFRDPRGDGAKFCRRFFRSMYVVADSTYAAFSSRFDAARRDREMALMRWGRINMDQPPQNSGPAMLRRIEREYRQKRSGSSDTEEDRILELQINLFNKIDDVMGEMENRSNAEGGIQLSLDWDSGANDGVGDWANIERTFFIDEGEARRVWLDDLANRLETFASFIGLVDAKDAMVDMISSFLGKPNLFVDSHRNIMLWGNPGTGKTEVGKILGPIFYKMGFLATDPGEGFVEKTKADFVAPFAGQTTHKTKMLLVNNLGGFLFLDEAYDLVSGGKEDMGLEALNQIVAFLGTYKGMITVAMAGYEFEIRKNLMESNPGLDSRFPDKWSFYPYNVKELYQIFIFMARKQRAVVKESVEERPVGRAKETLYFGIKTIHQLGGFDQDNARGISNLLKQAIRYVTRTYMKTQLPNPAEAQFKAVGDVIYLTSNALFAAFVNYGRQKGIKIERGAAGRNQGIELPEDPPGDDPEDDGDGGEEVRGLNLFKPRMEIPTRQARRDEAGLNVPEQAPPREEGERRRRGRPRSQQQVGGGGGGGQRRLSLDVSQINFDDQNEQDFYSEARIAREENRWRAFNRIGDLPTGGSTVNQILNAQVDVAGMISELNQMLEEWNDIRGWWDLALGIVRNGPNSWEWNISIDEFPVERFEDGIRRLDNLIEQGTEELAILTRWQNQSDIFLEAARASSTIATSERRRGQTGGGGIFTTPITKRGVTRRQSLPSPEEELLSPGSSSFSGSTTPVSRSPTPSPSPKKKTRKKRAKKKKRGGRRTTPPAQSPRTTRLPLNPTTQQVDALSSQELVEEIESRGRKPTTRGRQMDDNNRRILKQLLGLS